MKVKSIEVVWEDGEGIKYDTKGELYDYNLCKRIFKTILKTIKEREKLVEKFVYGVQKR